MAARVEDVCEDMELIPLESEMEDTLDGWL